jgi:hypothetical protein
MIVRTRRVLATKRFLENRKQNAPGVEDEVARWEKEKWRSAHRRAG